MNFMAFMVNPTMHEFNSFTGIALSPVDAELMRDGYEFLAERVYNPYDILLYLNKGEFAPYWFETATPSFLIKLLQAGNYYLPQLERLKLGHDLLGAERGLSIP